MFLELCLSINEGSSCDDYREKMGEEMSGVPISDGWWCLVLGYLDKVILHRPIACWILILALTST